MQVRSLGREDPLEESMATHSSILAWRNPWTEGPSRVQSIRSQRVGHDWSNCYQQLVSIGQGCCNILQCTGLLPQQKIIWSTLPRVGQLRNSYLGSPSVTLDQQKSIPGGFEMQTLRLHPRPAKSGSAVLRSYPGDLCAQKSLRSTELGDENGVF